MKKLITNYAFNKATKQVTFSDYAAGGINLERILLVADVTTGTILFNFGDATRIGTVSSNVLTLVYDTNTATFANTDKLLIYYDDPLYYMPITNSTLLSALYDSIIAWPKGFTPTLLTASGQFLSGPGQLGGFYVNSTSAGVIKIGNALTATTYVTGDITPAIGWHKLPIALSVGGYMTLVSGSINITIAALLDPT